MTFLLADSPLGLLFVVDDAGDASGLRGFPQGKAAKTKPASAFPPRFSGILLADGPLELLFVVDDAGDAACGPLHGLMAAAKGNNARILVAPHATRSSQKIRKWVVKSCPALCQLSHRLCTTFWKHSTDARLCRLQCPQHSLTPTGHRNHLPLWRV